MPFTGALSIDTLFLFFIKSFYHFTKKSLCSLPFILVPSKPLPISKPLVAGIDIIAWANFAYILSKQGYPIPGGTLNIAQPMVPPTESFSYLIHFTYFIMINAISGSGQRVSIISISLID